ncbi:hypothetical protein DX914_14930 [Lysobacter silvisoli]|uniref:Uncharacterized protein n=1 Tax=Lysobacter silvisoli TaxID=2293254 RepID=A0A371K0R5_9GAMM|nr:hypothetical protein DX914_14930 [Lysobacter silvisoli]
MRHSYSTGGGRRSLSAGVGAAGAGAAGGGAEGGVGAGAGGNPGGGALGAAAGVTKAGGVDTLGAGWITRFSCLLPLGQGTSFCTVSAPLASVQR